MIRKIRKISKAVSEPIADLSTYRALPTEATGHIDPFILLNHHGNQNYPKNNPGLPFGPHPHRGFETVTFIVSGEITHEDNSGYRSTISAGGVQWMTAGRGIEHNESASEEFLREGGDMEILQLWLNLPSKLKMSDPGYTGLQKNNIPVATSDSNRVKLQAVSGNWNGVEGAFESKTNIALATIDLRKGGQYLLEIPAERNILFYVISGRVHVNGKEAKKHELIEFANEGEDMQFMAIDSSLVLIGHGLPYSEPIVAHGPFVMNSQREIVEAYEDYKRGRFDNQ